MTLRGGKTPEQMFGLYWYDNIVPALWSRLGFERAEPPRRGALLHRSAALRGACGPHKPETPGGCKLACVTIGGVGLALCGMAADDVQRRRAARGGCLWGEGGAPRDPLRPPAPPLDSNRGASPPHWGPGVAPVLPPGGARACQGRIVSMGDPSRGQTAALQQAVSPCVDGRRRVGGLGPRMPCRYRPAPTGPAPHMRAVSLRPFLIAGCALFRQGRGSRPFDGPLAGHGSIFAAGDHPAPVVIPVGAPVPGTPLCGAGYKETPYR